MALNQYNYPQPTGLQQLGDVLMKGSGDYANIQLQRKAEERRRAQQLADLQDQRQFAVEQRGIERGFALTDEERRRAQALQDATVGTLIKEGWLKPTDARNPEAIKVAADARQARVGAGLEREGQLPGRLQEEADYLGKQDVELAAAESQLNAQLSAPEPGEPSQQEVAQRAILSLRTPGNPVPKDSDIAAAMPAAKAAIMQDRYMRWSMAKEDAKMQIQLLRTQRTALRQSLGALLQQGFTPNRPPPPVQALSNPGPSLRPASAAEASAAAGGATTQSPAGTAPSGTLSFEDINAASRGAPEAALPALRQAKTSMLANQYAALDAPALATREAITANRGQTNRLLRFGPEQPMSRSQWAGGPSLAPEDPAQTGGAIARFLLQSKQLQNQLTTQDQQRAAAKAKLLSSLQAPLPPLRQLPTGATNLDRSYDDPYAR